MIDKNTLVEVKMNFNNFIIKAMNFNLNEFKKYREYLPQNKYGFFEDYDNFYTYMIGLTEFAHMLKNIYDFKIYKQVLNKNQYNFINEKKFEEKEGTIKFFVIDKNGISHGWIYGATKNFENTSWRDSFEFPYYGFRNDINGNELNIENYDFVFDSYDDNKEYNFPDKNNFVNLLQLRENHLPLLIEDYDIEERVYFETGNYYDNRHYGPVIYRSKNQNFHLPFYELFRNNEEINKPSYNKYYGLSVVPVFKKDFIHFVVTKYWSSKDLDFASEWKGKISYEKFEIVEILNTYTQHRV